MLNMQVIAAIKAAATILAGIALVGVIVLLASSDEVAKVALALLLIAAMIGSIVGIIVAFRSLYDYYRIQ